MIPTIAANGLRPALAEGPATPVVLEGGILVSVTPDQRATLRGEAASIRDVVTEVCRQAGVELRGSAGPVHRYFGKLEDVSLDDAFRSLLREESYALGLRPGNATTPPRVLWLRVLGGEPVGPTTVTAAATAPSAAAAETPASAATDPGSAITVEPVPATPPPTPAIPFMLPTRLLFEAFNTVTPDQLDTGQREILANISTRPEQRNHFLATSTRDLAAMFRPYRDAAGTVRRLQSLASDREIQAKLDEVARALDPAR